MVITFLFPTMTNTILLAALDHCVPLYLNRHPLYKDLHTTFNICLHTILHFKFHSVINYKKCSHKKQNKVTTLDYIFLVASALKLLLLSEVGGI